MIKLKSLLSESTMSPSDFKVVIDAAKKATGTKEKIASGTIKLCTQVKKDGFHKIDYKGKPGKAREPHKLMYQYYAYVQGWGHSKYKNDFAWRSDKGDKLLNWIQTSGKYSSPYDYDYLKKHVNSDMQASQIVSDIRPGSKDSEPAYYLVKSYYNAFGSERNTYVHDQVINKVAWWLKKHKVETL